MTRKIAITVALKEKLNTNYDIRELILQQVGMNLH